ncbi:hypothetical protein B0H16DRAFT_1838019 [Mycena metata]|uniref:Uncharacterized protein n=1 Tax=Mycena metata TaxID=1033252 RepID=A0AAD7NX81_9AGAR|nr:hypothetical protein B0H16DRAFT_1838019 [Mycena metata]
MPTCLLNCPTVVYFKELGRNALESMEEFSLLEEHPDATQGAMVTHRSLGISVQGCRHRRHQAISQDPVQYPLTFRFDGNVERVGGIAVNDFHAESLHPGHRAIYEGSVQYPLTFSFGGNVEQVGGMAFHAEFLHPGHQSIAQDPVQLPLTFSFDGNVERVAASRAEYIAPSQFVGIMTPGASAAVRVWRARNHAVRKTGYCAKSYAAPSQFPHDGAPGIEQNKCQSFPVASRSAAAGW